MVGWDKNRRGRRRGAAGPNVDQQQRSKQVCLCISNHGVKGGDESGLYVTCYIAIKAGAGAKRSKSKFGFRWEEEHEQVIKPPATKRCSKDG